MCAHILCSAHDNKEPHLSSERHAKCLLCVACSFYRPRSNPEAYAITIHCLDPGTIKHVTVKQFDGQHWEEAHESTRINKS